MMNIGFVGLGTMGRPIVLNIARHTPVHVFDLCPDALRALPQHVRVEPDTASLAAGVDLVFTCLPTPSAVQSVAEESLYPYLPAGAVHVDLSTISPDLAIALQASAAARNLGFLSSPVSGGPSSAATGTLSTMIGGDADVYARVRGVFQTFAAPDKIFYCGDVANGAAIKLANNLIEICSNMVLGEAFSLLSHRDLDLELAYDVICRSSGYCNVLEDWKASILAGDFDPAKNATLALIRKDIRLASEAGTAVGARMEVTHTVAQCMDDAVQSGWGELSMTAVGLLHEQRLGTTFRFDRHKTPDGL